MTQRYRLVTRSDFDGLVCAALLKDLDMLDRVHFVHPKDMQDGKVEITADDITTNLPYVPGAHLVFDHHHSETLRLDELPDNFIIDANAPSAARVVFDHFGGAERFPRIAPELMEAVDRADSAQFSREEVLAPEGWNLLAFLMDSRTGLGRFRDFRVANYDLMMDLIDLMQKDSGDVQAILANPDVVERVELYREQEPLFRKQLERVSTMHGQLVVVDLRNEDIIHAGNRFIVYALFDQANVSMHIMWGRKRQNIVFAVGKSILDRSCTVNVGELMLAHGGGGHPAAGTCQIDSDRADEVAAQLIENLRGSAG